MKEPLTLQQSKDEVAKNRGYKNWALMIEFDPWFPADAQEIRDNVSELYRQSFIDSLRGHIEKQIELNNQKKSDFPKGYIFGLREILTLLNETSGETGK